MALYYWDGPGQDELRRTFHEAAAQGKYVLLLREIMNDELVVREESYARTVAPEEALSVLKSIHDRARAYGEVSVARVFEPGKTFDECNKTEPADTALCDVLREFAAYKEQTKPAVQPQQEPLWRRMMNYWLPN